MRRDFLIAFTNDLQDFLLLSFCLFFSFFPPRFLSGLYLDLRFLKDRKPSVEHLREIVGIGCGLN